MRTLLWWLSLSAAASISYAACDPTSFSHRCNLPFVTKHHAHLSQVYCGPSVGYITKHQYDILRRYQRVNTNMIVTINGEYVDSPCIPAGKRLVAQ